MAETKVKKCTSPRAAQRYIEKMTAQGWELVGAPTRSGIVNKRYLVTLRRAPSTPAPPPTPPRPV